jgi:hypothetical protein
MLKQKKKRMFRGLGLKSCELQALFVEDRAHELIRKNFRHAQTSAHSSGLSTRETVDRIDGEV